MAINELRDKIDAVDTLLISCLAKRQEIVQEIAEIKRKENLAVFCPERERQLIARRIELAADLGVDSSLVLNLFQKILENSRAIQEEIWKLG